MKHASLAFIVSIASAVCALAQTLACPNIAVSSPDSVDAGQPITYTASVSRGSSRVSPTFNWTVSGGTISAGQGTSSITLDTTGLPNTSVTATVEVGGYARSCSTGKSSTTSVLEAAKARMFDSTPKINAQERFDEVAAELKRSPGDRIFIIAYGGRRSYEGEAEAALTRAKNYIMKAGGIAADRITTVNGGYREEAWRELWIVPPGADAPYASPNVDPSEVVLAKPAAIKPAAKKPTKRKKP